MAKVAINRGAHLADPIKMSLRTLLLAWVFVGIGVMLFMAIAPWTTGFFILAIFGCITWALVFEISIIDVPGFFQFKRKLKLMNFFHKLDSTQRNNKQT